MIEISNPRALGLCFLFPPNPSIYSTETYRLREVLATTWQMGGGDDRGLGAGIKPRSSVSEDGGGEAKAEDNSRSRHKGTSFSRFCPPHSTNSQPVGSSVCRKERGWGAQPSLQEPVLSNGAQVLQGAMSSVCPVFAPTLPQGMARRGPRRSHPQGQLGGWQKLLEEEQERGMRKGVHQLPGRPSPPSVTLPLSQR